MAFLESVNIDENFWKLNPEIKYISPFNKFYEEDKDVHKNYSSKVMWAIYLYSDPDSRFARMDISEKQNDIAKNYLDNTIPKFWLLDDIRMLIASYEDKILTKLQKSYNRLLKKLEDRDNFIAKTPYSEKNAKSLDAMLANSSDIYQQLLDIENQLSEDKKTGNIKGGRTESLSEKKQL